MTIEAVWSSVSCSRASQHVGRRGRRSDHRSDNCPHVMTGDTVIYSCHWWKIWTQATGSNERRNINEWEEQRWIWFKYIRVSLLYMWAPRAVSEGRLEFIRIIKFLIMSVFFILLFCLCRRTRAETTRRPCSTSVVGMINAALWRFEQLWYETPRCCETKLHKRWGYRSTVVDSFWCTLVIDWISVNYLPVILTGDIIYWINRSWSAFT